MPDRLIMIAVVVLLGALLAGCPTPEATGPAATAPPPQVPDTAGEISGEVVLYVPCGMIIPIRGVMDAFEHRHPGVKLNGVFDNAGVLVERMAKKGEKADLFISPGSQELKLLVDAGLAEAGTEKAVGDFELVVITNREAPLQITSAEDLRKAKTISMPDPDLNSVGLSGKEALSKLGLWDELQQGAGCLRLPAGLVHKAAVSHRAGQGSFEPCGGPGLRGLRHLGRGAQDPR